MRIHYLHKWIALLPMLLLLVATSCTQDDGIQGDMGNYDNQVLISISTGNEITTRAANDIDAVIKTLHLFVFETDGNGTLPAANICCYNLSLENVDITKPVSLGSKEKFDKDQTYKICLIANYELPDAVKQKIEDETLSVSDLNSLIETEQNQSPFTNLEALLMEGESDAVQLNNQEAQPIEVSATLTRAAAKIVLNIKLADEFVDKYTPYTGTAAANNKVTFTNPALTTYVRSGQGIYSAPAAGSFEYNYIVEEEGYTITYALYSYACEWIGGDLENASSLVINIPVQPKDSPNKPLDINSYAISLDKFKYDTVDPAPPTTGGGDSRDYSLQRNFAYTITATVRALGSNEPSTPVKLEGVRFEAMQWGKVDIDIDGGDSGDFLSVNYHELSLTDDTENSVLHFDASDDVTVELDGEVYYYNKFGQRKIVGEGGSNNDPTYGYNVTFEYNKESVEGNVTIKSEPLPNNAPKYFRIKITNNHNQELVEYVDVVQYPLNYVTSTFGYYSSLRDTNGRGCDFLKGPSNNIDRYTRERSQNVLQTGGMDNDVFVAKYVRWDEVTWDDDGNPTLLSANNALDYYYYGNSTTKWQSSRLSTWGAYYKNPRMYHIRITTSSEHYTLGVPPLDKDGYTQSGADVATMVSPSFMIASQLGAFQRTSFNQEEAKKHCSLYEETTFLDYKEGIVVKYKNWRLPTSAELDIIGTIQKGTGEATDYDAIDEVLAYDRYWCSSGVWDAPGSSAEGTPAARCVRDANEPGEIIRIKDSTSSWPNSRPSVTPN